MLDLLSLKGESNAATAPTSIVGHVTAEPELIGALCEKLGDQVASTSPEKDPVVALKTLEALANAASVLAEPHLAAQLPTMLAAAAHKQAPVRQAAEDAVKAFAAKMSVHAVPCVLTALFKVRDTPSLNPSAYSFCPSFLRCIPSIPSHLLPTSPSLRTHTASPGPV